MSLVTLLPARQEMEFGSFTGGGEHMVIHLQTRRRAVPCPDCGATTERVHSRYTRTLEDLPWHGSTVQIRLQTRRFFCRATAWQINRLKMLRRQMYGRASFGLLRSRVLRAA